KGAGTRIEAWGLIAARLGNKRNRSEFRSSFWFDDKDPRTNKPLPDRPPRMQTLLAQWSSGRVPRKGWNEARGDFLRARRRVDVLLAQRQQAQDRLRLLPQASRDERAWGERVNRVQSDLGRFEEELVAERS
ncbi:MAG: hypothetical protein ACOX61_09920, partial [Brooklawnia sp.]